MAPPSGRIELDLDELERVIERARQTPLTDAEFALLTAAIHTLASVAQLVEAKNATIARLRQLLFGAATEKTREVLDRAGGTAPGADSPAGPDREDHPERHHEPTPGGHGRHGAETYAGAEHVAVPHPRLKHGDRCPECPKGKVYAQRDPGVLIRFIVGPSGTGKELVARAIALARYIPFDARAERFAEDFREAFCPLNISALPSALVESELFGHTKGAFTGAVADRQGWLETCPPFGTVFLDEVAEIDAAIQVKLLRVLQERSFQRLGDARARRFAGKIVAATNRDLPAEMQAGRFRPDLYYRLCSDIIETPPLAAQLRDAPGELAHLLRFLARRVAGEAEAEAVARETEGWITAHLGPDYPWPGNVRELEQCVRNVMVRGEYRPPRPAPHGVREELASAILGGALTVDAMLRRYCTLVFAQTGSYDGAARRLGIDRRTVKEKVDPAFLEQLTGAGARRQDER